MKTTLRRKFLLSMFAGSAAAASGADDMVAFPGGEKQPGIFSAGGLRKATLAVEVYYRDRENLSQTREKLVEEFTLLITGFLMGIQSTGTMLLLRAEDKELEILSPQKNGDPPRVVRLP